MEMTTFERSLSKKTFAYQKIKKMVIEGSLTEDTRLVERKLCDVIGVSRTPVREALRELASEGFVEIVNGKGIFVKKIDFKDMIERFEMRQALESMAIQLFVERASDEEINKFGLLMTEQEEAYQNGEHERFMKIDMEIHNHIAEQAQNTRIRRAVNNIYDQIHHVAITVKDEELIRDLALKAHRAIFKAISERDARAAKEAVQDHVIEVKEFYKERYYLL